ncbi:MAG TPA: hypothetical protein VEJ41_01840 [Candidatus Acidoferrales bacterium]|nr:hypothetical protein [Candidatus Acidoferrales bacterium]
MILQPLGAIEALRPQTTALSDAMLVRPEAASFADALAGALDGLTGSLAKADALSVSAATKTTDIAEAAVARARADVMLEVAAVAAARVSGALTQLLQTQL